MSAQFSAADLRTIAEVMDTLTQATQRTSVVVEGYGDTRITLRGHVMRLHWVAENEPDEGQYLIEMEDPTY